MCKDFATAKDYKSLASLVRVNKKVHEICQKYLEQAKKNDPQYYERKTKLEMARIEKGDNVELRLYPVLGDEDVVDIEVLEKKLLKTLRKQYGPEIYMDANRDETGQYYFELSDLGKKEYKALTDKYQMEGRQEYNGILYNLVFILDGQVALSIDFDFPDPAQPTEYDYGAQP